MDDFGWASGEPRFTRGEFLLLSTVVRLWTPLRYLVHPEIELVLPNCKHGLTDEALVDSLDRLFSGGLICAKSGATNSTFIPQLADISGYLREHSGQRSTYYGLTPEGGRSWEAFAQPDWSRFITGETHLEGAEREILCMDEAWLRRYCELRQMADGAFEPGSLVIDTVNRWEPTYWKTLPSGYRARFRELAESQHQGTSCAEAEQQQHAMREMSDHQRAWCPWT